MNERYESIRTSFMEIIEDRGKSPCSAVAIIDSSCTTDTFTLETYYSNLIAR